MTAFFSPGEKEINIIFLNDAPPAMKLEAGNGYLLYKRSEGFSVDFREKAMKELMDFKFHKALMESTG